MDSQVAQLDPELLMLQNNKRDGFNYRERRHEDWRINYELYRDKVKINRLIQRQTVNVPIMKQTVRTLLKDIDDMPVLYFKNKSNDREKETMVNEYWKFTVKENRMELQDIVDKRQVLLFGRSYDQWQVIDGKVVMTIVDPMDILVSRFVDPVNIHTSRFLIHTHIFKPLAELRNNPMFDQDKVEDLANWHMQDSGLIKNADNQRMLQEKNEKMRDMGLQDVDSPVLGETWVELSLHIVYRPVSEDSTEEELWLFVEADNYNVICKKRFEEVMGETSDHFFRNHFNYNSWGDDIERQDWYSDSVADVTRGSNQILNVWYSQLVENRTLRSMSMNFYDATASEEFKPQTYQPQPFGWYPLPGKPQDVYQRVDIPELSESIDEMQFVIGANEKATGATATQAGVQTERKTTLGEVQLNLGEAKERTKGLSKFYTPVWMQRGEMFLKIVEGNKDRLDTVELVKKGLNTEDLYPRDVAPDDWMDDAGYMCEVWSQDEKNEKDTQELEKVSAVSTMFPGNPKMEEIKQRKSLEFAGLSPDQINEVMEFERQKREALQSMIGAPGGIETPGMPAPVAIGARPMQPAQPAMPQLTPVQ